ncbi:hypothetical protein Q8F55_007108 [Vanrija albida]|uniref:Uncharacterized protein n=1 Tax=Vanrija albida TaxID=181172 RepID=A0ABR3PZ62_9TREE
MSSTRPKRGKAAATSKSAAKAKDDDKPFKFNPNEYESDVTDDDGDDDEYGVDAIKYAWYQNTEGDKGWRYGVMWKGYLKSTSDTVEPLTSFNEDDNGRIPFIDDFWKEVADRPLMRGTHEPLSGRVDEILETPKALLEEWLDKCRPRRDYKAYRRRRRAEKNDDPITKGMSDYYINHGSLVRYRKRQAEKAAGRKYEGSDSDEPKNRKIDERPKKKAREGDMGPPAPVQPKPEPPKPEPPKKRSTPPDDIPYSGPFGQSAEAGPSVRRKVSPTASLDSLFDERSSQEAGSRASSQVQAPPPKRRRVVDTSPEPVSKADQVSRAADRADKMSKMGKIKKQLPSDPSTPTDVTSNGPIPASAPAATPSFGELNPDIFGTPVASPAMPPPSIPSPAMPSPAMPSPAQSPYIPPSAAAQERSQNPLFDFGNTSGRSPTESEIDIDESITVKAEDGAAPDNAAQEAPIPPQPEAAPSAEEPMAVEEEDVSAPQTTAPPEATAITAVPSPVEADTAQTTSPDAAAAPLPTSETTGSPPPDKVTPVENGSASAATLGSSSTISVPASGGLPAKPTATTGDAGGSKPTSVITPSQRGKYVQPKKVKVLEFPGAAEANPQSRRLLSKLSTKPVSGSAGPPSAGPSSAASGPPSGVSPTVGVAPRPPAGFLTGSGSRWKNTPAAQAVAASAKAPSANYVPRNTLAGGVSPVIPHPGGLSPLEQRGGPGGRSPHDALGGGRSPYDPRAGGRSPHDPRAGGRSPHDPRAGGRSPHDQQRGDVRPPNPYSNRSPMAGNRSPVYGSSNTLMSTVTGAAGNQRVNGASGWGSGSAVPAHPSNGNRSPTWAQPAAGTARPTRPPAVRPAVVDPTRDPRRRPAG